MGKYKLPSVLRVTSFSVKVLPSCFAWKGFVGTNRFAWGSNQQRIDQREEKCILRGCVKVTQDLVVCSQKMMPWSVPDMPQGGRAGQPALHELPEQQTPTSWKGPSFLCFARRTQTPPYKQLPHFGKCRLTREFSTAASWQVSLSHYWGLRGDDNPLGGRMRDGDPPLFVSSL